MAILNYDKVARQLETHSCPTCGAHPEATVQGTDISIKCCCEEFRDFLTEKLGEYLRDETGRAITERFNKAFKKGLRRR